MAGKLFGFFSRGDELATAKKEPRVKDPEGKEAPVAKGQRRSLTFSGTYEELNGAPPWEKKEGLYFDENGLPFALVCDEKEKELGVVHGRSEMPVFNSAVPRNAKFFSAVVVLKVLEKDQLRSLDALGIDPSIPLAAEALKEAGFKSFEAKRQASLPSHFRTSHFRSSTTDDLPSPLSRPF